MGIRGFPTLNELYLEEVVKEGDGTTVNNQGHDRFNGMMVEFCKQYPIEKIKSIRDKFICHIDARKSFMEMKKELDAVSIRYLIEQDNNLGRIWDLFCSTDNILLVNNMNDMELPNCIELYPGKSEHTHQD